MTDLSHFPTHPAARAEEALGTVVAQAKDMLEDVFGREPYWPSHRWDVTEKLAAKRRPGKARQRQYLIFSQHSGAERTKIKQARADELPFDEPFGDLVKAYVVLRQSRNGLTKENHMEHVRAWRFLYIVSADVQHDPTALTHRHFADALGLYGEHTESDGSRYQMGKYLAAVSNFLDRHHLCAVRIHYENPVQRPTTSGGVKQRKVAEPAGKQVPYAKTKLPEREAIVGLGKLARLDLSVRDALVVRGMEILLALGLRIGELLALSADALQTIDSWKGGGHVVTRHKLEYWAEKNESWDGRWIPDYALPLVQRAFTWIKELTARFRVQRRYLEQSGFTRLYVFRDYDPDDVISSTEVFGLLGGMGKAYNVATYLQKRNIASMRKGRWRVGDIEEGLIDAEVERGPLIDRDGRRLELSEGLFLIPQTFMHAVKRTSSHDFNVLQLSQIDDRLVGRATTGVPAMFKRYGITGEDGKRLRLNTHQLRHWLNTLMQRSRQLTQLEIASLFGRKYLKDNEAYDHSGEPIDGEVVARKMLEEHEMTREALDDFQKMFPLLSFEDAVAMKGIDLGAAHVTDVGICFMDYAQEPCGKHLVCLRECDNYIRVKGNKEEIEVVRQIMERTEEVLAMAREAVAAECWGANRTVMHNEKLLAGCRKALAVEALDVPDGTEIRVFVDERLN